MIVFFLSSFIFPPFLSLHTTYVCLPSSLPSFHASIILSFQTALCPPSLTYFLTIFSASFHILFLLSVLPAIHHSPFHSIHVAFHRPSVCPSSFLLLTPFFHLTFPFIPSLFLPLFILPSPAFPPSFHPSLFPYLNSSIRPLFPPSIIPSVHTILDWYSSIFPSNGPPFALHSSLMITPSLFFFLSSLFPFLLSLFPSLHPFFDALQFLYDHERYLNGDSISICSRI